MHAQMAISDQGALPSPSLRWIYLGQGYTRRAPVLLNLCDLRHLEEHSAKQHHHRQRLAAVGTTRSEVISRAGGWTAGSLLLSLPVFPPCYQISLCATASWAALTSGRGRGSCPPYAHGQKGPWCRLPGQLTPRRHDSLRPLPLGYF